MNSQLLLGTSCVDITPAIPVTTNGMGPGNVAKSVESPLEIRAFTFSMGRKAFTLLSCDLLCVDPDTAAFMDEFFKRVGRTYTWGTSRRNFMAENAAALFAGIGG